MVFQDPYESLNPSMTHPATWLRSRCRCMGCTQIRRNGQACAGGAGRCRVETGENYLNRYPHELSGGQRQRVVIAGALVLEPVLLLADEPVSMLDVSIRAEILQPAVRPARQSGISVIFITHDLGTVAYFCDRMAVMYLGSIVEIGPTRRGARTPAASLHQGPALGDPRAKPAQPRASASSCRVSHRTPSTSPQAAASIRAARKCLIVVIGTILS